MKKVKRTINIFLVISLLCGIFFNDSIIIRTEAKETETVERNSKSEYQIYPVPQSIKYGEKALSLKGKVNVVVPADMSNYVKEYVKKILNQYHINFIISDKTNNSVLNLYLSTVGKTDDLNNYFNTVNYNHGISTDVEEGYVLSVNSDKNIIGILGNNESGVFNGLSTFSQMLDSSSDNLKDVTIEDSANAKFRGVVEGFYGEYTHEERMDLIQFMGPLKMNTYIYGAKFDDYHNDKWREPYPDTQLKELKELVETGKENNIEVVWTAHVGGHIEMGDDSDYQALVAKFDQLYSIGVRQFGLFYDDAWTDNTHLVEFINRLYNEYLSKKGDVKDLIFCPQSYNYRDADEEYLKELANFHESVQIMWTGDSVISEVTPSMMKWIENIIQRPAYIWWNYPVNDLSMEDQLLVGETVGLSNDIERINGLVSNPLLQEQSSKFSLFSIADYSWNIKAFDRKSSWNAAVDYIIKEKEFADAFKVFATNNNQSMWELKDVSVESEYLVDLFNDYKRDYYGNKNIDEKTTILIEEFKKIERACEKLLTYTGNKALSNEIESWVNQQLKLSQLGISILKNAQFQNSLTYLNEADFIKVLTQYEEDQNVMNEVTNGRWTGRREIIPFLQMIQGNIHQKLLKRLGKTQTTLAISNCRGEGHLNPNLSAMVDGDKETLVDISEKSVHIERWLGIDLGVQTQIDDLTILIGASDNDTNVPDSHKVQISTNGVDWKDIKVVSEQNHISNVNPETARFVRYVIGDNEKYSIKVREFIVNQKQTGIISTVNDSNSLVIHEQLGSTSINADQSIIVKPNEYVGIYLEQDQIIQSIENKTGLKFEYSIDGVRFDEYDGKAFEAKYIRLINDSKNNKTVEFNDDSFVMVTSTVKIPDAMTIEEIGSLDTYDGDKNNLIDGNRDSYHWTCEQYTGNGYVVDLGEKIQVKDIAVYMSDCDWMDCGVIEVSVDKASWEKVGDITNNQVNIAFLDKEIQYVKILVTGDATDKWMKIAEIEINQLSGNSHAPIISDTQAQSIIDNDLLSGFTPSEGGTLEFNNFDMPFASKLNVLKNEGIIKVEAYNDGKWVELVGEGNQLVSYSLDGLNDVYRFRISWEDGVDLSIYEIGSEIKKADYSKVDEAIANVPKDLTIYTDESVKSLQDALDSVIRDLDFTHQEEVDAMANAINKALKGLVKRSNSIEILPDEPENSTNPNNNVDTGDYMNMKLFFMMAALTGAGYTLLRRKKEEI